MEHRRLGSTGHDVSAAGLGTWNIGGDWAEVPADDADARRPVEAA